MSKKLIIQFYNKLTNLLYLYCYQEKYYGEYLKTKILFLDYFHISFVQKRRPALMILVQYSTNHISTEKNFQQSSQLIFTG
jgi:hypothetical protein